jgi:hypothetical protein
MGHVFVSYSHKDKDYVHKPAAVMQSEGFEVWIDDRIDYGTRWPIVVENAIDSCEAFILIASENSHTSEWVQHEFVRAQRLEKHVFPVLLSGDPWLSFESTQYFDARDGSLPAQKFYTVLRNNLNVHLKVIKEMVIGSWPVYINKKYGFSISYPLSGSISDDREDFARIEIPVLQGTTLREKFITIHCNQDGIFSSPLNKNMPVIDKPYEIDILGIRYLREGGLEGGMSKLWEWMSYSTSSKDKIVTISLRIMSSPRDVFLPSFVPTIDLAAEKEILLYILSTFTWLD